MQLLYVYTVVFGLVWVLVFSLLRWVLSTLRPKGLPPGPPIILGLGNLHQIPAQKPYLKFDEWAKEYGDMFSLKTGTGNLVVINRAEIVHELFDRRGAIYSDRPASHILTKHVFYEAEDQHIAVLQYDDYYRRWRKAFNHILSAAGIKRVTPLLEAEAARLSQLCGQVTGDGRYKHDDNVERWSYAVPLIVTNGARLDDSPEYFKAYQKNIRTIMRLIVPGSAPPVDIFPVLRYIPRFLASCKQILGPFPFPLCVAYSEVVGIATRGFPEMLRLIDCTLKADPMQQGKNKHSVRGSKKELARLEKDPGFAGFISLLAKLQLDGREDEKAGKESFTDTQLGYIGQAMANAAADTTSATTKSLLLAFAAYPEALRRAQEEVDRVAGLQHPPGAQHQDELVYLKACISEILRWRPTAPSALPHVLSQDDSFGGYRFPKGTVFIANAWSIHRHEAEYEAPNEFVPERFLHHPYGMRPSPKAESAQELGNSGRRALYTFGSGRRLCPGEQFAFTAVLLAVSKIIWAYDILPPPGGVDVTIETGFVDGTVTQPVDSEIIFRYRDAKREQGVAQALVQADTRAQDLLGG